MSTHKKNSPIYNLAREAKSRIKTYAENNSMDYKQINLSKDYLTLYSKVCKMLSSDKIITNPISELYDKVYYNSLSIENRQKYILALTEKYKEMKLRYEREQNKTAI